MRAHQRRLQWAAVLPWLNPDAAVEELRWAKEHGACGIFKRGFDIDRKVTDPHFFPVYEEASRLDNPHMHPHRPSAAVP